MTAKTDISKCLSLLFGKLKLCIFLSFIVLCLLQPTANYDLAIIEDYLAGNAKIKISIKKWRRCHIPRALATVANRKCGPENRNPNYLSIQLGAKSNKNFVQQKAQRNTYILTRPCMVFFKGFKSKKCFSVVTCKIRRAFSIEGSFNKINKFIFN